MTWRIFEYIIRRNLYVISLALDLFVRSYVRQGDDRVRLNNPMRVRIFFERAGGYLLYFGRTIVQSNVLTDRYQDELSALLHDTTYTFSLNELSQLSFAHMRMRVDLALLQFFSLFTLLKGNKTVFNFLSQYIDRQYFFLHTNIAR